MVHQVSSDGGLIAVLSSPQNAAHVSTDKVDDAACGHHLASFSLRTFLVSAHPG